MSTSHRGCRFESVSAFMVGAFLGCLMVFTLINFGVVHSVKTDSMNFSTDVKEGSSCPGAEVHSDQADVCRSFGWTIHRRFALRPNTVVARKQAIKPCAEEDSDGWCFWNAKKHGNGEGQSFIIKGERDGKHRIWWVRFR